MSDKFCALEGFWPKGQQCPIAFCDIEGKENRGKTCHINTDAYSYSYIAIICVAI